MKSESWSIQLYCLISQACGAVTAIIGSAALAGWFVGSDLFRAFRSGYIPMAPNTAILFLLLGILLVLLPVKRAAVIVRTAAVLALTLPVGRLAEYFTGVDFKVDQVFFQFPSETLGLAPVGKMAFFTAATFVFGSTGLFLVTFPRHWTNDLAKGVGIVVAFIGLAFSLGYLYGAPLMYDGTSIPMALNTAICFCAFGTGVVIVGAIRDLRQRRQASLALQAAHEELEQRVKERTQELSHAVSSLEAEITERRQAEQALRETEEQLRQSQKLEAVGRLAGGIAHDFNNLLTVIIGYSDLLLLRELDGTARERLQEINKASKRASSLTRQLLAFSRKQVMKPQALDINSLLESSEKMLRRLIGEDVEVATNLHQGIATIMADPCQVEQILFNLVVNARDAMPDGGKLTIETTNIDLDDAYADLHLAVQPGSYIMLSVSDTGIGMDAETQKKIFEPFFTTKEVGKGTGLGLSMVYGIVKQCGGNIWVYSELGRGTTFKIYFPRIDSHATSMAVEKPYSAAGQRRTETILLVEDDDMVRKLAHDILKAVGYRLLVAGNGEEALKLAKAYTRPIHLLLTDVIMPRMTGREVAEAISALHPETAVLFMSGYTDDVIVRHGVLERDTNLIEKPFTADLLLAETASVLANHECYAPH